MVEQILLSSGSFDRVREIGGFGQPLHTLYPQIQAVLANELGADAANLLAEPVVDRAHNRIDWYTEGDPDCKPIVLSELPEEQRQPVLAQIQSQLQRGRELAEQYAASGDPQRMQLGAMLKAALGSPTETNIFLIKDQPVLAHWGFATDRPWETGGPIHHSPVPPPLPSEASQDVAIPDITMPELASSAVPPAPAAESPEQSEPSLEPSSGPSSEKPAAAFADTIAPPPLPPPPPSPLPPSEPAGSMETETPIPLLLKSSPPSVVDRPGALLRYVVVGSRYFWSVAVLAVLLALGTFLWSLTRTSMHPLVNRSIQTSPNVTSDASLREAWRIEQALRTKLEQRLTQLAAQRGRCPLPVEMEEKASPASTVPVPSDNKATVAAAAEKAIHDKTPSALRPAHPDTGVKQPAPMGDVATALESGGASDQTTMITPVSPDRETPPTPPDLPIPVNTSHPLDKDRSPANTASPPQAPEESLAQTLEKALQKDSRTALNAPASQPPVELPMQAEPTPEERQEFTNRLSATGATTGEITATLLWNGNADLDLVVYCPSGQMLDYQNPKECGGTLDVDANTARHSLSDRPVENVFWPAGQAAPGTYQIAVRYAPRKDEQHPQPTPFQIRLIRNNQEKVFKGTAQPRKAAPVTGFTVER